MIRLMEGREVPALSAHPSLGLLCALELAAYENRYPFSQVLGVYTGEEGVLTGALSLFYGAAVAWESSPQASGELATYLKQAGGWEQLLCRSGLAQDLGLPAGKRVYHLIALGEGGALSPEVRVPKGREDYDLLSLCDPQAAETPFDGWYADRSHRARRGLLEGLGLYREGRLAATLAAAPLGEEVFLLDIATHPDFRGQGLCRQLLGHVRAHFWGKRLHLLTADGTALRIYEACGFHPQDHHLVRIQKENTHAAGIF